MTNSPPSTAPAIPPISPPGPPTLTLLDLPQEILTLIAIDLARDSPRSVINLSLTSRFLYHGVLSSRNTFLWYRVLLGDVFTQRRHHPHHNNYPLILPGFSDAWRIHGFPRLADEPITGSILTNTNPPPQALEYDDLDKQLRMTFNPNVDYRRMLTDTMLGLTDSGCQDCLREPVTGEMNPLRRAMLNAILLLEGKTPRPLRRKSVRRLCYACALKICWNVAESCRQTDEDGVDDLVRQ